MALSTIYGDSMRRQGHRTQYGFTMVEVVAAMVIFAIALTGLVPLLAILSRDLQPIKKITSTGSTTYNCATPARDGNVNGADFSSPPAFEKHVWYITPSDDLWMRQLGVVARLYPATMTAVAPTEFTSATSPIPLVAPLQPLDDDTSNPNFAVTHNETNWDYIPSSDALNGFSHRHTTKKNNPNAWATWTFTVPMSGWYSIQATWPPNAADQISDAKYTATVNAIPILTVPSVNQSIPPNGVEDANGQPWQSLVSGPVYLAKDAVLVVQLNNDGGVEGGNDTYIAADGVRIVRNDIKIVSVERSMRGVNSNSNNMDVTAHVAATVNIPQ
jgi:prepilin-type N-terminal cleavage/methylation domain-containing protein